VVEWTDVEEWPAPDEATVREVEAALGVRLPADFVAVATAHPHAAPEPGSIDVPGFGGTAVDRLMHFTADEGDHLLSCLWMVPDSLEPGLVPFATDIGGDLFCFDYRESPDAPSAGFWCTDTGYVRLADGFTELVGMLGDRRSREA
jgi:hypothetical protein